MGSCEQCLVRNRAICAALDVNEIGALNAIGRHRVLTPGESLIWEGDDSVLVANVIEGVLKLSTGTEDGREQSSAWCSSDFSGPFAPPPAGVTRPIEGLFNRRFDVRARTSRFAAAARGELDHSALGCRSRKCSFLLNDGDPAARSRPIRSGWTYRASRSPCSG
jgi:CRP-like cAMP-binding protein